MSGMILKLALLCVVLGVALSAPQHVDNCDHWCRNKYNELLCCDKLECPVDNRRLGDCHRPVAAAAPAGGNIGGPRRCYSNDECGRGALCCMDNCLGHRKCTNV